MPRVHLSLLIHAHQPLGNFENVQEDVYKLAYLPFVETVGKHTAIRIAFHYSGILLEWLEKRHPEYLERLKELTERGQAEMLGGGYYEPVLSAIPDRDRLAQMERLSDWIDKRFGRRPRGAWLTERVWDPSLPRTLAQAGIEYTLTDDYHFLSVGLEKDQLHGYYLTEWQGSALKVIPGLKELRYLLPFRMENEAIAYLQQVAPGRGETLAAMGDDLEKFGAWPETHKHVYTDGWLRRFFEAVERSSEWMEMTLPGDYVEAHEPLGRIYLPTASYQEMMGWALPPGAGSHYEELLRRVEQMPDAAAMMRFVHGGVWHNFFHKYDEANHMHKRMLDLSGRYEAIARSAGPDRDLYRKGYEYLLAAQCNDAYWHGVFGGLYAPHLRTSVYDALLRAEEIARKLEPASRGPRRFDLNLDGADEILLSNDSLSVVVMTADGGTVGELSYRRRAFNVINSLQRRPEIYHAKLRQAQYGEAGGAVSIHDRVITKEPGLDRHLHYDRYKRHSFRSMVFPAGRTLEDYRFGRLEEWQDLAGGRFQVISAEVDRCLLECQAGWSCEVQNEISIREASLEANWRLIHSSPSDLEAGLELVLNLLAPDAPDRYFVLPESGERPRLSWAGEVRGDGVSLVDEWLNLRIDVRVQPAAVWWIVPIFTVSQSEEGFEKVYQGSCLLPHWPVKNGELRATLKLSFAGAP